MTIRNAVSLTTGTFNGVAAASQVSGSAIFMGNIAPRVKYLSANLTTLAETNTITLTAKWQVSNDNSTWYDVAHGTSNAAGVALGTGTAGADTAVTKVILAPDACYGWQWARVAIVVGVTTGATADTYSISYAYRQVVGADR